MLANWNKSGTLELLKIVIQGFYWILCYPAGIDPSGGKVKTMVKVLVQDLKLQGLYMNVNVNSLSYFPQY